MNSRTADLDVTRVTGFIVGGLSLLLYGISHMSASMKTLGSDRYTRFLTTPLRSFTIGFIGAGIMQSSTAVALLVLSAQIGTTLVNQLVSWKISSYALWLIGIGFFAFKFTKNESMSRFGKFLFGVGILFHGNYLLTSVVGPLKTHQPFIDFLSTFDDSSLLALSVSMTFTFLVQSSAATISIAQVLTAQGIMPLRTGLAFVLGANIGNSGSSVLASIGASRTAFRVSICYVLIKIVPALVTLAFLDLFEMLVRALSSKTSHPGQLLANGHTIWNLLVSCLLLPLIYELTAFMYMLVPKAPDES